MTIRLQIRDAIVDALNLNRPGDIPEATKRAWTRESDKELSMAVVFMDEPVTHRNRQDPLATRKLIVGVECVGSALAPELTDDTVEPLLSWAVKVLGDTNLDGLVHSVEEDRTTWERAQLERFYMRATVRFSVSYQTRRADLDAKQ